MKHEGTIPLIVGEVFVDFTILASGVENKMRLGGVVHAARAFWATNTPYAVAAFLPDYLEDSAKDYLARFGCEQFFKLGTITGALNVIIISDVTEVADQGYEILLRDAKSVDHTPAALMGDLSRFDLALVIPGTYDVAAVLQLLPEEVQIVLDAAYDVDAVNSIEDLPRKIDTLIISTSSKLFRSEFTSNFETFAKRFSALSPQAVILKENRGGCRAYLSASGQTLNVPAYLGKTVSSVGVGDALDATYVSFLRVNRTEAVWRGAQVASCYAQTTDPDLFKEYVRRELALTMEELSALPGAFLPWEERPKHHIYLAAPDFTTVKRTAIDCALSALNYHNCFVRRPVKENGELPQGSGWSILNATYHQDVALLESCDLVFAVPTDKDPGTLVEIGIAIAQKIPVVVYDPQEECPNTMVMAGAWTYSRSLDECLNGVFDALSQRRDRQP
ncbi:MAG TPA: nucleoside 2-deoxyribosyltransferase [Rhizomicrobium sp.]|jgi:nucleoside 2-deoxyribosyltransferase